MKTAQELSSHHGIESFYVLKIKRLLDVRRCGINEHWILLLHLVIIDDTSIASFT